MSFNKFSDAVAQNITDMSGGELYVVALDVNDAWEHYLSSFPDGTNNIFRERAFHDCSCCKHFIRNMSNVVSLQDGSIKTIWQSENLDYPYDVVSKAMDSYVRSFPVKTLFRTAETHYGSETSSEMMETGIHTWNHFRTVVDRKFVTRDIPTYLSGINSAADVFKRGLEELTQGAMQDVLDLILEDAIYRGAEHKKALEEFIGLSEKYRKINDPVAQNIFIWQNIFSQAARFRNTVIGTLVQELSEGVDIDRAVRSFESKVAPENYKRPTALITAKMVSDASKTLTDLGMESAIHRRFAKISDVSVNNVLFVDNSVQEKMKDGIEGLLAGVVTKQSVDVKNALAISVEDFMKTVLPSAETLDLHVTRKHQGNFMSLTAPQEADTGGLFKWNNDFGWSYDGDVTDTMKEKVKRAGGDVDADFRVSLGWYNGDDLDLHMTLPSGDTISFRNKMGYLDVDMNAGLPTNSKDPVENIRFKTMPRDGIYKVMVNNFSKRSSSNVGFELEVECLGEIHGFTSAKSSPKKHELELTITVKNGQMVSILPSKTLQTESSSMAPGIEKWGVVTNTLVRVDTMMLSPNFWDEQEIGNKHWFFLLKNCKNPNSTRGIYNEFLNSKLEKHRKVFEVLGSKTKCEPADEQLSGLGFSSTRKDKAIVIAKGPKINRAYEITF